MKWIRLLRPLEILQVWFIGVFACAVIGAPPTAPTATYLLVLLFHIAGTYFLNDYFDWSDDRLNPRRTTFLERPVILCVSGAALMVVSSALAFSLNYEVGLIFLMLNLLGLNYSMPPLRLKARQPNPMLIHAICGAFYFATALQALLILPQLSHILYAIFWAIILASGSLYNEVLDHEPDKTSGIITLGQKLSFPRAKEAISLVHGIALCVFILAVYSDRLMVSFFLGLLFLVFYLKFILGSSAASTPESYRAIYRWLFAALTLVTCAEALIRFSQ